jgi:enoyl-CoA hydratase
VAVELTRRKEFAVITLNRPEALNALSFALLRDLGNVADSSRAARARHLTGPT